MGADIGVMQRAYESIGLAAFTIGLFALLVWLIKRMMTRERESSERMLLVIEGNATSMTKMADAVDRQTAAVEKIHEGQIKLAERINHGFRRK